MNKKLIVGNWKLNPEGVAKARTLFTGVKKNLLKIKNTEVVMCAPYVFLPVLKTLSTTKAVLGAQNVWHEASGAYTGEVSVKMLKELSVKYAIVGHSERRAMGEDSNLVSLKINALLKANITPILCVGESNRDNTGGYLQFIKTQLVESLAGVPKVNIKKVVIAYEPIWAIGKNATREATVAECMEMSLFIKKVISDMSDNKTAHAVRILYGGSVNANNAKDFLAHGGVGGLLVGRACLSVKDFTKIILDADK
jgi:triosephosphate isomerase